MGESVFVDKAGTTFTLTAESGQSAADISSVTVDAVAVPGYTSAWTASVVAGSTIVASYAYTANAASTPAALSAAVSSLNGASGFSSAGYVASTDGTRLIVTNAAGTAFQVYASDAATVSVAGKSLSSTSGSGVTGEVFTLDVGSASSSFTIGSTPETLSGVAKIGRAHV